MPNHTKQSETFLLFEMDRARTFKLLPVQEYRQTDIPEVIVFLWVSEDIKAKAMAGNLAY